MIRAATLLLSTFLFVIGATVCEARPEYLDVLLKAYPTQSAKLSERSCTNCHVSDSDFSRNAYGKQVGIALEQAGSKELTPGVLHNIETMDLSSGGGAVLAKINAGKSPADLTGGSPEKAAKSAPAGAETARPWFPSYAYHPAVVHFPIALFIGGMILDLLGMIRKSKTLLIAGWYNLVFAGITAFGGIGSGFLALYLMKVPFAGLIRQHIIVAIVSTAIIWTLVALRMHRHERMTPRVRALYYVLALAGMLLVSYAGHLGGQFVYGG